MGEAVADQICATFTGQEPEITFTGEGGCYLEVGSGKAMMVKGNFLAVPEPEVALIDASPQLLDEKRNFEAQRLQEWFG
jgi:sulfide:quinone oxidoreductase